MQAQARARNVTPKVLVVSHPVGGLNTEELAERIDTATNSLRAAIGA